jgi:site-specific recombinase XerD
MRLSKAIAGFMADAQLTKSKNTLRSYACELERMRRYIRKDTVAAFDEALVTRVLGDLVAANRAANTKSRCMSTLREFSKWSVRKGLLARDVLDDPKFLVKGQATLPRPYTLEEAEKIMALELSPLETALRALLFYTGMRNTPICDLLVGDVTFTPAPGTVRSTGKGNKKHSVPMAPGLSAVLAEWLRANPGRPYDRLLRDAKGRPLNQRRVERFCIAWGTRAGVADCQPHRFRHTAATEWLRGGAQLQAVQRLLGHANIQTTLTYAKVQDSTLIDAVMGRATK